MNKISIMEASVRKWDRIIAGKGSDGGVLDCPPCRIFYVLICVGCPIAAYTGKKFCKGSPYGAWYHHQCEDHGYMRRKIYCPECTRLATDMRNFMVEIVDHMKSQKQRSDTPERPAPAGPPSKGQSVRQRGSRPPQTAAREDATS